MFLRFSAALAMNVVLSVASIAATPPPEQFLREKMQELHIPAAQLAVIQHGRIVKLGAYGIANVEHDVPATSTSIFSINSCTKAFIGVAIMQLVEAGKINIDDPVSMYLHDLPVSWQKVTIRQAMSHTSGLPNIIDEYERIVGGGTAAQAWETVKNMPLEFPAGERYRYNQTGYVMIGKIIEQVSGQTFSSFVEQGQFKPARMTHTRFGDSSDVVHDSAGGYSFSHNEGGNWIEGKQLSAIFVEFPQFFRPAAGILSTSTDIARWLIALQNGSLLKDRSSIATLWQPVRLNDGSTAGPSSLLNGSALGWPVAVRDDHPAVGPIGGMRSTFFVYPKDDLAIVVLTNLQGANPELFIDELASYYIPDMAPSTGFGLPPAIQRYRAKLLERGFDHAGQVFETMAAANESTMPNESELNAWAYRLASQKAVRKALAILALNTRLHAESWNAFDSYGEILEQSGDRRGAIDNYRRSLVLNPANQNAADHLKRLESSTK